MIETIAITVISFVAILVVLVFAHEFGHFITAKLPELKWRNLASASHLGLQVSNEEKQRIP